MVTGGSPAVSLDARSCPVQCFSSGFFSFFLLVVHSGMLNVTCQSGPELQQNESEQRGHSNEGGSLRRNKRNRRPRKARNEEEKNRNPDQTLTGQPGGMMIREHSLFWAFFFFFWALNRLETGVGDSDNGMDGCWVSSALAALCVSACPSLSRALWCPVFSRSGGLYAASSLLCALDDQRMEPPRTYSQPGRINLQAR